MIHKDKQKFSLIPEKYLDVNSYEKNVDYVKRTFQEGNLIEAFGFLYTIIELELMRSWRGYLIREFDNVELENDWDFNTSLELLFQVKLIDKNQRSVLLNFKNGRNQVIHHLVNPLKRNTKLNHKLINSSFRSGMKAYDIIETIALNLLDDIAWKETTLNPSRPPWKEN